MVFFLYYVKNNLCTKLTFINLFQTMKCLYWIPAKGVPTFQMSMTQKAISPIIPVMGAKMAQIGN